MDIFSIGIVNIIMAVPVQVGLIITYTLLSIINYATNLQEICMEKLHYRFIDGMTVSRFKIYLSIIYIIEALVWFTGIVMLIKNMLGGYKCTIIIWYVIKMISIIQFTIWTEDTLKIEE